MQTQIYVAGDVHLLKAEGPFMDFLAMLLEKEPAQLIILGDLFDYWLETNQSIARYQAVFDAFQALKQAGWQLEFVFGNRELSAGPRLRMGLGVRSHWPDYSITVNNQRIRIVHGDRLCYDPGYHMMATVLRGFWSQAFHLIMPAFVHHGITYLIRNMSKGSSQAPSAKRRLKRVFIDPRRVAAHKRHCDILIAGHIHQEMHKQVRGVELFVLGDWQGNTGHWLEIDSHAQCLLKSSPFGN